MIRDTEDARRKMIELTAEIAQAVGERNYRTLEGLVPLYVRIRNDCEELISVGEYDHEINKRLGLVGLSLYDDVKTGGVQ